MHHLRMERSRDQSCAAGPCRPGVLAARGQQMHMVSRMQDMQQHLRCRKASVPQSRVRAPGTGNVIMLLGQRCWQAPVERTSGARCCHMLISHASARTHAAQPGAYCKRGSRFLQMSEPFVYSLHLSPCSTRGSCTDVQATRRGSLSGQAPTIAWSVGQVFQLEFQVLPAGSSHEGDTLAGYRTCSMPRRPYISSSQQTRCPRRQCSASQLLNVNVVHSSSMRHKT
jgi:hypothetical protein